MLAEHAFSFWTWLGHFTGTSDESGPGYGFFSGIGSDIGEIVLIGAIAQVVRHHTCHQKGCRRIGMHRVGDSPYRVCVRHHPDMDTKNISAEHISHRHHEWKKRTRLGLPETPESVTTVDETS